MANSGDGKMAEFHDIPESESANHGGKVISSAETPARNEFDVLEIERVYKYV